MCVEQRGGARASAATRSQIVETASRSCGAWLAGMLRMNPARRTLLLSLSAAALSALIVLLIPRRVSEPPHPLPVADYLPPASRESLHRHMNRHGADLLELSWAVVLLDDDVTAARAERLAAEPALAPLEGVPQRFYPLQNELQSAAVQLGQAARAHDGGGIARAYGRLAATCAACHRVYLRR